MSKLDERAKAIAERCRTVGSHEAHDVIQELLARHEAYCPDGENDQVPGRIEMKCGSCEYYTGCWIAGDCIESGKPVQANRPACKMYMRYVKLTKWQKFVRWIKGDAE